MAKEKYAAYATGKDAAYIKPKLIPDDESSSEDEQESREFERKKDVSPKAPSSSNKRSKE